MAVSLAACSGTFGCQPQVAEPANDSLNVSAPTRASDVPDSKVITIAFLGDSLTAGLGLTQQEAFPDRIKELFAGEGYGEVDVLNGGVSGDTTAGGLRRVDQLIDPTTRVLVVALGGNDALRGLSAGQTHDNVAAIVDYALGKGLAVLVAGMQAPTNLGEDYQTSFRGAFERISREYQGRIEYVPFLLEGVAGNPALNQADGIHPTAEGARIVAQLLYPKLRNIIDRISNGAR